MPFFFIDTSGQGLDYSATPSPIPAKFSAQTANNLDHHLYNFYTFLQEAKTALMANPTLLHRQIRQFNQAYDTLFPTLIETEDCAQTGLEIPPHPIFSLNGSELREAGSQLMDVLVGFITV